MENSIMEEAIRVAAKSFLETKGVVRLISHHDSDGISGAAIIINMLARMNLKFSLSIEPYLNKKFFEDISKENYETYIFIDIGSSEMNNINHYLKGKRVYILDHHISNTKPMENVIHINPWDYGIDGSTDMCGSAIAFYFAREVDKTNSDLAHLAIIGAIGDIQNLDSYKNILYLAKKIKVIEDIKIYGAYSRSLFKVLSTTTEPYIPGVSGTEQGTIKFLKSIGIPLKKGREYTKLSHLGSDDKEKLIKSILQRNPQLKREDIFGKVYLLKTEKEGSPIRDCREFSTMLNACGRLNKPSIAIGACLNNQKLKKEAISLLREYRRNIIDAFSWFEENRDNVDVNEDYIIFNAKDKISSNLISVITTIISNSTISAPFVVGMARDGDVSKVSLRLGNENNYNLMEIIKDIPYLIAFGGHKRSAGALLKIDDEERFMNELSNKFKKIAIEETIE